MNIEQCKETYEALKKGKDFIANIDKDFFLNFAETVLSELEKKDEVINEMTEDLYGLATSINEEYRVEEFLLNKETIKKYFINKVESGE